MTHTMLVDLLLFGLRPPRMHSCVYNRGLPESIAPAGLTPGCWSQAGIQHCCAGVVTSCYVEGLPHGDRQHSPV